MNLLRNDHSTIEPFKTISSERKEWTDAQRQKWLEEYLSVRQEPPALLLGERSLIQDCSKCLLLLFGLRHSDLVWQPISKLFPQFAEVELIRAGQVNPYINYLCRCGKRYQSKNRQGDTFSCNLSFVGIEYEGRRSFRMIVRPK
jgi:hypothetical protein